MPHFKSTFQIQRNKMFFAKDTRFPSTYSRMFRDRLRHVLFQTCWDRVPLFAYAVRIASMSLPTARFICILYAEIRVNATAENRLPSVLLSRRAGHSVMAITKTSGKLGTNHYRKGVWDRLEGQDSINRSINKVKMPRQYNCCVPGCTNSHNCCDAAFLLKIPLVLSLQTIPSAFALLVSTQVSTRFGSGQLPLRVVNIHQCSCCPSVSSSWPTSKCYDASVKLVPEKWQWRWRATC